MDGWSNNSSYTSGTTSSGGWGNSGQSATSRGYGSSSSDYSSSSHDDSSYWSNNYGGGSGNQSAPVAAANKISGSQSPMQIRVEAKVDAKNPANVTDRKASLTGGGLAGEVAAPNANYWSGATDGWRNNTAYTDGKKGEFGTDEHIAALNNTILSGKAHEGQIETAKAMAAGKRTVNAKEAASSLFGTMGAVSGLPMGGLVAGKAGGYAVEAISDYNSGFKNNAAYNQSKKLASDDTSIAGTVAGMFTPGGAGGMVKTTINDMTGNYRSGVNTLDSSLQKMGYTSTAPRQTFQQSGTGGAQDNSLLGNMMQTQQAAPSYDYSPAALDYGNFYSDMGSTI